MPMSNYLLGRLEYSGRCIGSQIEAAGVPDCRVRVYGDTSLCETCHARWDTNEVEGNNPPNCQLQFDPFRGGVLT